jgi:hypothetical protein
MLAAGFLAMAAGGVASASAPAHGLAGRLGVVTRRGNGCHVLQLTGPAPAPGTAVQVVRLSSPQTVAAARVVVWRTCFDGKGGPVQGRRVALDLGEVALEAGEVAIGVVDPPRPVEVHEGHAVVELEGDGVPLRFRACRSAEGLHLTAWSGKPLESTRHWHAYHFRGREAEPTCQEADWRP